MRLKFLVLTMFSFTLSASSWSMTPRRRPGVVFPQQAFWDSLRVYDEQKDIGRKVDSLQVSPRKSNGSSAKLMAQQRNLAPSLRLYAEHDNVGLATHRSSGAHSTRAEQRHVHFLCDEIV